MEFGAEILTILFILATISGFIDAIAGGGGLITIPALLAVGIPPTMALGTNKLQACGGSFSSSLYFIRKKVVAPKTIWFLILCAFLGAMIGTLLVQSIDASVVKKLLPFLVLTIGIYFLLTPKIGEKDRHQRLSYLLFGLTIAFTIGFYDGFFGPGTGSFFTLTFVTLLGFNLTKATAHAKVLNLTSNITALFFFILGGKVLWSIGFIMMLGQFIGAYFGAKMVVTRGQHLIRPMVVVMSFLITAKMVYDHGWFQF
ncbi:hypothetical protein CEP48_02750 [Mergibacter septicus]|uniref:Probable membrane transporter protein n=1 Tax=Mergibacter septicus TaxID=221402 RepID=A0A8E3MFV8_9PAST|nr:TSUP family transporter [Mergibacter septicus]AWX15148.1 hypothetical protein CEP47_02750 [Mergibacter septicus]QDJ14401.1 hypothetical protein CEP48_02750 [Mergibacter septicus]UTU48160.1 TSUP family transporter [Mergibacter septicus]WMR96222.1 TSUP family transporter [Mergibacter septicus]